MNFVIDDEKEVQNFYITTPDVLVKSYVQAHYRHDEDGKLVFVHGYHNKKTVAPKDLTLSGLHQQGEDIHPKAKPSDAQNQNFLSFRLGDEVFVDYSHMHDNHFLVGAVVGVRSDPSHAGKLIQVRFLDGTVDSFYPNSLTHIYKVDSEERKYEKHPNFLKQYKELLPEQRQRFYDLYKLWFRIQRMGEIAAFNANQNLFVDEKGNLPKSKKDLTAEQKIQLEKLNKFPIVPFEAILTTVTDDEYTQQKHHTFVKGLLADIEKMEKEGIPNVVFPKLVLPKSKKKNPYVSPAWMEGLFPSVVTYDKEDNDYDNLSLEIAKKTKLGGVPSAEGNIKINYTEWYHAKPIVHGKVFFSDKTTVYPVAPTLPSVSEQKEIAKEIVEKVDASKQTKEEKPKKTFTESLAPFLGSDDISDLNFTVVSNAKQYGGAHTKYILEAFGEYYLFKPFKKSELYRTWADIATYKIAKKIGLQTAKFGSKPISIHIPPSIGGNYAGTLATGSVQKIIPNLKYKSIKKFSDNSFVDCPKEIIESLQKEQVLDWLVGNNDAHNKQFVIDKQGQLVGLDKGQAFKFYEQDVLSTTYDPNHNQEYGNISVYNLLFQAAKSKQIKLDWKVVSNFIDNNISKLSEDEFLTYITPYAKNSVKWVDNIEKFQDLAISRLNSLKQDFEKFYSNNGIETGSANTEPEEKHSLEAQPGAFQQLDEHFLHKVINSKNLGFSIMMGGGHIEDMSVVFRKYNWVFNPGDKELEKGFKHKQGLEISFKLLPGYEAEVNTKFNILQDQETKITTFNNNTLPEGLDNWSDALINCAITVNHHSPQGGKNPDGKYNPDKLKNFAKVFQETDALDLSKPLLTPSQLIVQIYFKIKDHYENPYTLANKIASYYAPMAEEVFAAIKNKEKTKNKNFTAWKGDYSLITESTSNKKYPYAKMTKFEINPATGELQRRPGHNAIALGYDHDSLKYGTMFEKNFDGNITARYYPHYSDQLHGQNNLFSQQGKFVIDFSDWDGSLDSLNKFKEVLGHFGIDNKLATHDDLESLYLIKTLWDNKANITHKATYKKILSMPSGKEKIEKLKDLCQKSYGTPVDSLTTYNPMPHWDDEAGAHYFLNPYVTEHFKSSDHKYLPFLTVGISNIQDETIASLFRNGLLSTEQRLSNGMLQSSGMSSFEDQTTGGASYVFTTLKKIAANEIDDKIKNFSSSSLVLRPELLARTDTVAHSSDSYGIVGTHMKKGKATVNSRMGKMEILSRLKDQDPFNLHEVCFKNRVSLKNWLYGVRENFQLGKKLKELFLKHHPQKIEKIKFV